jgi:hypothetical protein
LQSWNGRIKWTVLICNLGLIVSISLMHFAKTQEREELLEQGIWGTIFVVWTAEALQMGWYARALRRVIATVAIDGQFQVQLLKYLNTIQFGFWVVLTCIVCLLLVVVVSCRGIFGNKTSIQTKLWCS